MSADVTFSPAPKPGATPRVRKPWAERYRDEIRALTPEQRQERFGFKPRKAITRKKYLPRSRKPIPQVNVRAARRRNVNYRKVIASDFHKKIRYEAYLRSGGLCECDQCAKIRTIAVSYDAAMDAAVHGFTRDQIDAAFTPTPVWFTKKGGEPSRRFRSRDGEFHHDSYRLFGQENPEELNLGRWTWKVCHRRIEATHHTRRRFFAGTKEAA